jgi:hypothetical protein
MQTEQRWYLGHAASEWVWPGHRGHVRARRWLRGMGCPGIAVGRPGGGPGGGPATPPFGPFGQVTILWPTRPHSQQVMGFRAGGPLCGVVAALLPANGGRPGMVAVSDGVCCCGAYFGKPDMAAAREVCCSCVSCWACCCRVSAITAANRFSESDAVFVVVVDEAAGVGGDFFAFFLLRFFLRSSSLADSESLSASSVSEELESWARRERRRLLLEAEDDFLRDCLSSSLRTLYALATSKLLSDARLIFKVEDHSEGNPSATASSSSEPVRASGASSSTPKSVSSEKTLNHALTRRT